MPIDEIRCFAAFEPKKPIYIESFKLMNHGANSTLFHREKSNEKNIEKR